MSVILYSKNNCPQCEKTKRDMDILGIEYTTINLADHPEKLNELISLGFRSAPVVKTDTSTWSGYNQDNIKALVTYG